MSPWPAGSSRCVWCFETAHRWTRRRGSQTASPPRSMRPHAGSPRIRFETALQAASPHVHTLPEGDPTPNAFGCVRRTRVEPSGVGVAPTLDDHVIVACDALPRACRVRLTRHEVLPMDRCLGEIVIYLDDHGLETFGQPPCSRGTVRRTLRACPPVSRCAVRSSVARGEGPRATTPPGIDPGSRHRSGPSPRPMPLPSGCSRAPRRRRSCRASPPCPSGTCPSSPGARRSRRSASALFAH